MKRVALSIPMSVAVLAIIAVALNVAADSAVSVSVLPCVLWGALGVIIQLAGRVITRSRASDASYIRKAKGLPAVLVLALVIVLGGPFMQLSGSSIFGLLVGAAISEGFWVFYVEPKDNRGPLA